MAEMFEGEAETFQRETVDFVRKAPGGRTVMRAAIVVAACRLLVRVSEGRFTHPARQRRSLR